MDHSDRQRESLTVDVAVRRILIRCGALPPRSISLRGARGLVLAVDIYATLHSPRFDTSAMDGYAVQAGDARAASPAHPVQLPVIGAIAAGVQSDLSVVAGTAVRIMTGARCPVGADAVVPLELVREHADRIEVTTPLPFGANIRRTGEDIAEGSALLTIGTRLLPTHLALLAAEGMESATVIPRPRVAIIATGDEVVPPGQALEPGHIWDSNSAMVTGLVEQFGGEIASSILVPDEPAGLLSILRHQAADGVDLILTVGGASRGDRDVLAEIAGDGIELDFWNVQMKPGRPLVFGVVDGVPLIGLPGNPAAAFVAAVQFLRPAIVAMLGRLDIVPPMVSARVAESIPNPGGRRNYVRVKLDMDGFENTARIAGPQNVANILTLSKADGLLVIPESMSQVEPGALLDVQVIREL
jgi:molybdopterin molybdotransferase